MLTPEEKENAIVFINLYYNPNTRTLIKGKITKEDIELLIFFINKAYNNNIKSVCCASKVLKYFQQLSDHLKK